MKVIELNKEWWAEEREPSREPIEVRVARRRKAKSNDLPEYLTVREVAEKLRKSEWFIYQLLRSGKLDYQPIGRQKRIPVDSVLDYLESEKLSKRVG